VDFAGNWNKATASEDVSTAKSWRGWVYCFITVSPCQLWTFYKSSRTMASQL
jgi:hypothetical protein